MTRVIVVERERYAVKPLYVCFLFKQHAESVLVNSSLRDKVVTKQTERSRFGTHLIISQRTAVYGVSAKGRENVSFIFPRVSVYPLIAIYPLLLLAMFDKRAEYKLISVTLSFEKIICKNVSR